MKYNLKKDQQQHFCLLCLWCLLKMTRTCIVCKKQPVPGDNSRTFHRFPLDSNMDQKKKWLTAIGRGSVAKNATICSDHFEASAYYGINDNSTIKRLLPNAVPCMTTSSEDSVENNFSNVLKEEVTWDDEENKSDLQLATHWLTDLEESKDLTTTKNSSNVLKEEVTWHDEENKSDLQLATHLLTDLEESKDLTTTKNSSNVLKEEVTWHDEENKSDLPLALCLLTDLAESKDLTTNNVSETNNFLSEDTSNFSIEKKGQDGVCDIHEKNENLKRKRCKDGIGDISKTRYRFMDGFVTKYISREDFVSDEAWRNFLRMVKLKNSKLSACRRNMLRKEKKITNIKQLVKELKKREVLATAEYFEV